MVVMIMAVDDLMYVGMLVDAGSAALGVGLSVEVHPGEILLILIVLVAWGSAVAFFIHRWRFIRILQPSEPRYRHCPKNLEHVKVVTRHRDSVIYKNYSENMSRTMMARQKRLDRMNTMPNMRVCDEEVTVAARSPVRPRSESDLPDEPGETGALSFRQLTESCTSIIASIHSSAICPVIEVEEDTQESNGEPSGLVCTNV